ncbi:MAG: bifunctional oligoribonuclease/PAP phosphatase NrnA [Bacillota bacterium]
MKAVEEARRGLLGSPRLLLLMHRNPDGDTIGSALGLGHLLRALGRDVRWACPDPIPPQYRGLPGAAEIGLTRACEPEGETLVALDCADLERTALPVAWGIPVKLNIDHHPTNTRYAEVNWVDPRAAAVGELIVRLAKRARWPVTPPVATCLYAAIMTDTGSFRHENTTSASLKSAASLVRAGASPHGLAEMLYEAKREAALRLLARALASFKRSAGGGVAYMTLTASDFAACDADEADSEGIVNYACGVAGIRVGLLFMEGKDGSVRVGLRSRPDIDVSAVASELGGGGHPRAAGCTVPGPLAQAIPAVLALASAAASEEER